MICVDAAKVKGLIAEAGNSNDRLRIDAGISSPAFYRMLSLMDRFITTLKKLSGC